DSAFRSFTGLPRSGIERASRAAAVGIWRGEPGLRAIISLGGCVDWARASHQLRLDDQGAPAPAAAWTASLSPFESSLRAMPPQLGVRRVSALDSEDGR